MRLMKMFGIAAMMVMAVTAFAGVSSAAATQVKAVELCKAAEKDCSKANQYGVPTTLEAESPEAILKGTITDNCKSTTKGETTEQKETELAGKITSLTFTNCNNCPATVENLPYGAQATTNQTEAPEQGHLIVHNPRVTLKCFFGLVKCVATAEKVDLEIHGGNPGTIVANEEPLTITGPEACGTSGTWTATYTVTNPKPVWISDEKEV